MLSGSKFIAWKVLDLRFDVASVRYRALMPALGLRERGYESILLQQGENLTLVSNLAAAVFVKSFSPADLKLAQKLRMAGVRIFLDLCDNVFVSGYESDGARRAFGCFNELAQVASAVVVPTEELGNHLGRTTAARRIVVIPDQVETQTAVSEVLRFRELFADYRRGVVPRRLAHLPEPVLTKMIPTARRALRFVDRTGALRSGIRSLFQRTGPTEVSTDREIATALPDKRRGELERKRIIWFGNHGAPHSKFGMPSLAGIVDALAAVNDIIPLELVVVSNNHPRFKQLFANTPFPALYREWQIRSIFDHVSTADVCVLPNPKDDFSIGKSPNRALLALALGVPVVADFIPSLSALQGCMVFDDWIGGISAYLFDPERAARDVLRARAIIRRRFGKHAIAAAWQQLLEPATEQTPSRLNARLNDLDSNDADTGGQKPHIASKSAVRDGVSVAMCTFNGERFLDQQLASLLRQTNRPAELVICDDGSVDGTVDILERFARHAPFPVRLSLNAKRLGIRANFEQALSLCTGPYIALADQDDIWTEGRLAESLEEMKRIEAIHGQITPTLIHSDMTVVDKGDRIVDGSYFRRRGLRRFHREPLKELIAQNYVTGCTTLMNRALLSLALPIPPTAALHDWWIGLVAAATGVVHTVDRPLVRYRAHDSNAVGAKKKESLAFLMEAAANPERLVALAQSQAIERVLSDRLPKSRSLVFLERYHALLYQGGLRSAIALGREGVRYQNWFLTLIFLGHVTLRSFQAGCGPKTNEGISKA
jgi:glycosyltransferase involved in cell wall biosynthesis